MSTASPSPHRALLVITSHGQLGDTGNTTGYTVSEAADPWQVFVNAGWEVDLTTVRGGRPPEDGFGDPTQPNQVAWAADPDVQAKLDTAPAPAEVDPSRYDAVYFVGGHGSMWDFPGNNDLSRLAASVYEHGGVVAAVCHGPSALTTLRLSDGSLLVEGKSIAAFTDSEEREIGLDGIVPFLLQSRLEELGAKHTGAAHWKSHIVVDGRLVTGQNPASAAGVAEAVTDIVHAHS
ncbi:type 1 glutamine amidotransferase domain-containing protein [Streptomyces olivaceoviridis]|uniref:type 1 glutamine amidotransferase domain-containing protein n=1 Tax=Streptomyces olivaceoviridis TaxID=1921 RepID=UPI003679522A